MTEVNVHCYDIRTPEVAQLFASFGRLPMKDWQVWSLSLAQSCLPEESVGFEAWITKVAGCDIHEATLANWAIGLADELGKVKPLLRMRRRKLFKDYRSHWGRYAAIDGVAMALFDRHPPTASRAAQFNCSPDDYQKCRDLIAGFLKMQAAQFEDALTWAVRQNTRIDIA